MVMMVVVVEGGRQPLSLRQAVSHQSRLAGCSEQQQQHRFLSALTETDGRLRCRNIINATKDLIRNRIQLGVKHEKQKQNPLDSTKTEPPSLQEQSGWSANNKAVANCAFSCSFCYICRSRWQPALTSAIHPLVIYLLEPTAVNHGWGHATIAHLLFCAEKSWVAYRTTALWASSLPHCRPSLLAKVFHYEPFCLWARGAAHYDNHSGRVGYAPCLLYIVLLWWDTVACVGQGERRCSRWGRCEVGWVCVWGGVIFNNRLVLNGLTGDNIWFFFERASAEAAVNRSGRKPVWLSPLSSALPTHIPLGPLL